MSTSKYAPRREDGLFAYVVTTSGWGRSWEDVVWAETLTVAKRKYGWTRELHTSKSVRRASIDDLERLTTPIPAAPSRRAEVNGEGA